MAGVYDRREHLPVGFFAGKNVEEVKRRAEKSSGCPWNGLDVLLRMLIEMDKSSVKWMYAGRLWICRGEEKRISGGSYSSE